MGKTCEKWYSQTSFELSVAYRGEKDQKYASLANAASPLADAHFKRVAKQYGLTFVGTTISGGHEPGKLGERPNVSFKGKFNLEAEHQQKTMREDG